MTIDQTLDAIEESIGNRTVQIADLQEGIRRIHEEGNAQQQRRLHLLANEAVEVFGF
jgi:hypothetical protein